MRRHGVSARTLFPMAACVLATSLLPASQSMAAIGLPGIPLPGGGGDQLFKGAVVSALRKTLHDEAPILPSTDLYPTVDALPGGGFRPNADPGAIFRQITSSRDGTVTLAPGDYQIPVATFCMKAQAHSPNGNTFRLARLQGKSADIITALNSRAVGSGIAQSDVQTLSWDLQAGMKYQEIPGRARAVVDRLIPDFKSRLNESYYERIQSTWAHLSSTVPGLPSLDSSLSRMGDVGNAILTLKQTRDELLADSDNFNRLSSALAPPTTRQNYAGTPWSATGNGVYERLLNEGSFVGPGTLQIRVAGNPSGGQPTRSVHITDLVGNPNADVQPLSQSPSGQIPTQVAPANNTPGHHHYSIPCPGSRENAVTVISGAGVENGLDNLRNSGPCALGIQALDKNGKPLPAPGSPHNDSISLQPGQTIEHYKAPPGTAKIIVACFSTCGGTGSVDFDVPVPNS